MSFFCFPAILSAENISLREFVEYSGESASSAAGGSMAAGDINADGYSDLIISAGYFNNGVIVSAGAVYLIYGQNDLLLSSSLSSAIRFTGEDEYDSAGWSVSSGDINGDGYDDIIIGASGVEDAIDGSGSVYLIYGQAEHLTSSSLSTAIEFTGENLQDHAGVSVSSGDINGDSYDDIFIGARSNNGSFTGAGAAYLIYGQAENLTGASLSSPLIVKFTGEAEYDDAGGSVSANGDVNGDGYNDLLIGARRNGEVADNAGAAYLIYGQADHLVNASLSTAIKFTGEAETDDAGDVVHFAGDVNNDGKDEILISAKGNNANGVSEAGAAYLIYGQAEQLVGASLSTAIKFTGEAEDDFGGYPATAAGDVNNDGFGDLIFGAYGNDTAGLNAGAAYLINGQAEHLTSASLSTGLKFTGEASSDYSGFPVTTASDVNNDGYDDILITGYLNDDAALDAGAAYLGYVYVDADHDGVPGNAGLLDGADTNDNDHDNDGSETGTDCNDDDSTISANQTYYQDSDEDTLGNILVTTSVCSLVAPAGYVVNSSDPNDTIKQHPIYYTNDVNEDANLKSVAGATNGRVKVTYDDDSIYYFTVYSITSKSKTKVKQYNQTGYYLVLQPKAKKLAILNVYTGEVLSRKVLSKKAKYKYNSLKIFTLRNKKWATITAKNKKGKVKLSVVRIKIASESLGKKAQVTLENKKIKPAKTKRNHNTILLRSKNNKILNKYLLTKKINLREI
ncbi:MAG: hypothetical protein WC752_04690 [Patescibacteria group bacterium]